MILYKTEKGTLTAKELWGWCQKKKQKIFIVGFSDFEDVWLINNADVQYTLEEWCQGTFNSRIPACCFLFLISPLFLFSSSQQEWVKRHAVHRTEVIGWDMHDSPSVNILLTAKLLSHNPLSWDRDCLLTFWPLLIPCSLGKGCCTFGVLIFIIVERNSLYNSLYILTERSLKHPCSIRAWVPVSFFLFFFLSLFLPLANSLERGNPLSSVSCLGFQDSL